MQKEPIDRQKLYDWIPKYHAMSPILDTTRGDDIAFYITDAVCDKLLPSVGKEGGNKRRVLSRSLRNPETYAEINNKPDTALDVISALMDIADMALLADQAVIAKLYYESIPYAASQVDRLKVDPVQDVELDLYTIDANTWLMFNDKDGPSYETRQQYKSSRIDIVNKIISIREDIGKYLEDGKAFEYALKLILEFALNNQGQQNSKNSVRIARTREDAPLPNTVGSTPGAKLGHDVVLTRDGVDYRVQAKFGSGTEAQREDYDLSQIVFLAETEMTSKDLDDVFSRLLMALNGDSESTDFILSLADRYNTAIIGDQPTIAAKKIVERSDEII